MTKKFCQVKIIPSGHLLTYLLFFLFFTYPTKSAFALSTLTLDLSPLLPTRFHLSFICHGTISFIAPLALLLQFQFSSAAIRKYSNNSFHFELHDCCLIPSHLNWLVLFFHFKLHDYCPTPSHLYWLVLFFHLIA